MLEDDWYDSVADWEKQIKEQYDTLKQEHIDYLKKHPNHARVEKSPNYWGLSKKECKKYMKGKNNHILKIGQFEIANAMPQWSHNCQRCKFTAKDLESIGTVSEFEQLYLVLKQGSTNIKFNKPYYLCDEVQTSNTPNLGNVNFVKIGHVDNNEDCIRSLSYFYRSALLCIDRQPYVPDFDMKILDTHGTRVRPEYRILVYAFGAYLKLNIRLTTNEKESRNELTKNDSHSWSDKMRDKPSLLTQLFYDNAGGASRKFYTLASWGGGEEIIKYLRKDDSLDEKKSWMIRALNLHLEGVPNKWKIFEKYFNLWKNYSFDISDSLLHDEYAMNNDTNEWIFGLLSFIKPNECLCAIKAIELIASRIITIINGAEPPKDIKHGLYFVKLIVLMLDIAKKGNIYACSDLFMPMIFDHIELYDNVNVENCLNILNESTTMIGETLRAIGNLSSFDFTWLLQNKHVHQVWNGYFNSAFLALLDSIHVFESNLGDLFQYSQYVSDRTELGMCDFYLSVFTYSCLVMPCVF